MTTTPMSENLVKELASFGLSGNEAKVYLALIQLKKANARTIAKLSNVPRQEIYRVLPQLERLGMIEVIIGKPTKFQATSPEEVLSELIERQQENLTKKISEIRGKKDLLENELKKVEGRSSGLVASEPVRFALISGSHLVNEKVREMLQNAKSEVLWMVPKLEISRAFIYDRDRMLHKCAKRNVKIRILTEIDKKDLKEVSELSEFCEIRHSPGVTSLTTIIDDKELIIGSAVHGSELMHELWTNDSSHIKVMKDFFEKVWTDSIPAKSEIESIKSGRAIETIAVIQGQENVKKKVLDSIAQTKSKLLIVSRIDDTSISLITSQLDALEEKNVLKRWVTIVNKQNIDNVRTVTGKVKVHFLKERPISFLVTDSDCLFSSTPILQIPKEIVWSSDHSIVNMFWVLAEEIWNNLSEDFNKFQLET